MNSELEKRIVEELKSQHEIIIKITTESLYAFPYSMTKGFNQESFLEFVKGNLINSPFKIGYSDRIIKMEILNNI